MKDKHVIDILDETPFGSLSPEQLDIIRSHSRECSDCTNAYQAAKLSSVILAERVQTVVEPSPFFQTRVMAALREQQSVESVPAWLRLWKSAGALVSSMAVATVALAALTFAVPANTPEPVATASSAESVIFDQGSDELSYEQVLSTIYAEEDEGK
jgi:anti-sigma-K factor RskA